MGKYANNFVKCPSCGHIGNTSAMQKCAICGHSLNRASLGFSKGIIAGGGTALVLGAISLAFRPAILSGDVRQQASELQQQASEVQEDIAEGIGDAVNDSIDAVSSVLPEESTASLPTGDNEVDTDAVVDELAAADTGDVSSEDSARIDSDGVDSSDVDSGSADGPAQKFLSDGGRLLFPDATDANKEAGIVAYASGDYAAAISGWFNLGLQSEISIW